MILINNIKIISYICEYNTKRNYNINKYINFKIILNINLLLIKKSYIYKIINKIF